MKINLFIVFGWVALLLAACQGVSESERMEEALAQGEVLYGEGDNDSLVFVPGLEQAALYFAERKQWGKAAHVALYNGRAQNAANNKTAAMQSFKAAEQYGGQAGDTLMVAWAQYETGRLLFKEGRVEESLAVFREGECAFGKALEGRSLSANMSACCHLARQQYDSVAACLERSMAYAEQAGSDLAKRKTLNNYSVQYYMQGDYETSKNYLRRIMTETSCPDMALLYLNIGDVYFGSGVMDSAARYYRLLEELLPLAGVKDETKVSAYRAFSRFAERQGDSSKALRYERLRGDMERKIMEQRELESVYRVQRKYDFDALRNDLNKKIIQRQRVIIALIIIIALALVAFALAKTRLANARKQEAETKADLLKFMQENQEYKAELTKVLRKEQRVMQKLKVYLSNEKDPALLQALNYSVWGGKGFWDTTLELFDQLFPNLRQKLTQSPYNLTEKEQKTLILLYLDASREDTALLLGSSVAMVDKMRASVRKKIAKAEVSSENDSENSEKSSE